MGVLHLDNKFSQKTLTHIYIRVCFQLWATVEWPHRQTPRSASTPTLIHLNSIFFFKHHKTQWFSSRRWLYTLDYIIYIFFLSSWEEWKWVITSREQHTAWVRLRCYHGLAGGDWVITSVPSHCREHTGPASCCSHHAPHLTPSSTPPSQPGGTARLTWPCTGETLNICRSPSPDFRSQ